MTIYDAYFAWENAEVRRMLGLWVSELEPSLAYRKGVLIGLTIDGIPIGEKAPIIIKADHTNNPYAVRLSAPYTSDLI